jgi:hypothetical protein
VVTPIHKKVSSIVPAPLDKKAGRLLTDLRAMIESARQQVAHVVDSGLVVLYWQIGKRIQQDVLGNKRAAYGKQIVYQVGRQLTLEYGEGFSRANLFHMMRFVTVYPDEKIVYALSRQLGWTHFRQIIYLDERLRRDFYARCVGVSVGIRTR